MSILTTTAGLALLVPLPQDAAGVVAPVAVRAESATVSAAELERTVRVLASDALRGRALGSEGSRAAALYCAAELERHGLEPLGDDGTFLQALVLHRFEYVALPEVELVGRDGARHSLVAGVDFTLRADGVPADHADLEVVLATSAEEVLERASVDAALAIGASPGRARRWVRDERLDGRRPPVVVVPGSEQPGRPMTVGPLRAFSVEPHAAATSVTLTVVGPWARAVEAGEIARVSVRSHLVSRPVEDMNTVGLVRGAGAEGRPELAAETIVVSAHRDHIGLQSIGRAGATEADVIANGADDDASGCAVLLELARCLAAGPPPERSVVFLLVTGEESGLLGSRHYVEQPLRPLESTVANLNLEMLGMEDPLAGGAGRPWLTGFERSDLGALLVEAGLDIQVDPRPRLNLFARSDNLSFARVGIVAHTLSTGGENPNYHQVRDEWDTLDYEHMRACAQIGLEALRLLASGAVTPVWNEGEPALGR